MSVFHIILHQITYSLKACLMYPYLTNAINGSKKFTIFFRGP